MGHSVMQYIRKRRLLHAANELKSTKKKVMDIAYDFGFNSHVSFTRAFKSEYGSAPDDFRKNNKEEFKIKKVKIKCIETDFKEIEFLEGPKIVYKDSFTVVGMSTKSGFNDNVRNKSIEIAFNNFLNSLDKVKNIKNIGTRYGIAFDTDYSENFSYLACIKVEKVEDIPAGMVKMTIPQSKYAVFTYTANKGSGTLKEYYQILYYIYIIWLPQSGYELVKDIAMIELLDERCTIWDNREVDIYIPIL